jgi:MFS family permease
MENKATVSILRTRRNIQKFCQKHSRWFLVIGKLIDSFALFVSLNHLYGKSGGMALIIAGILALACSGIPLRYTFLASVILTTFHLSQVSWDLVVFYLAAALLSYLMVHRLNPDAAVVTAFVPLFFYLKVPFLLPLLVGMFSNMFGVGAMIFGVLFYFFGTYVQDVAMLLSSTDGTSNIIAVKNVMDSFSGDAKCLLLLAAFVVTALLAYILYHQAFDYAWYVAIILGGLAGFFVYLAGGILFDIQSKNLSYVLSILISMVLAALIQFFRCIIDYGSVEYLEFEDDSYYYYVKAVPKVTTIGEDFTTSSVTVEERPVKHL